MRYAERIGARLERRCDTVIGARLLGVVDEVALHVKVGLVADDLDRVLVGADRAVGAEPVEDRRRHVGRLDVGTSSSTASEVWVTSSVMPTVKWFFGACSRELSKTALTIAGVNSFDASP